MLEKPSIIPALQQIKWNESYFPLYRATSIILNDTALFKEAIQLQKIISNKGWQLEIKNKAGNGRVFIELELEKNKSTRPPDEAYTLNVTADKFSIVAKTTWNVNAIQTLRQLMEKKC